MDHDLQDGFESDAARSFEAFRLDTHCKGEGCCGWRLSNLDAWAPCRECNEGGSVKSHPEMSFDD